MIPGQMIPQELTQGELIQIAVRIYHDELMNLRDWDFDFVISILSAINYRQNKILWDGLKDKAR